MLIDTRVETKGNKGEEGIEMNGNFTRNGDKVEEVNKNKMEQVEKEMRTKEKEMVREHPFTHPQVLKDPLKSKDFIRYLHMFRKVHMNFPS